LYEGTLNHEKKYMACYLENERSTFVATTHKDKIVGVSTSIPLSGNSAITRDKQQKTNFAA
jgi:hypothetical protein